MSQDLSKWAVTVPPDYTMTLGAVIAAGYDSDDKLHLSADWYPIYDESHRSELNDKICQNYALREIGQESVEQFIHYLGMTMGNIMPYFNERYRTLAWQYDPLTSTDVVSESDNTTTAQSSSKASSTQDSTSHSAAKNTSNSTTSSKSYDSDVPATGVQGDFARYASHANEAIATTDGITDSTQDSTSHTSASSATDYSHDESTGKGRTHTTGRGQSATSLVQEYRNAVINVDMEIIRSLEPCFLQLWGGYDIMPLEHPYYDCEDDCE